MDKEHIEGAKGRARLVVDGMARVKDQQARDLLKLVEHIEEQENVIRRLENRIDDLKKVEFDYLKMKKIFGKNPFGL